MNNLSVEYQPVPTANRYQSQREKITTMTQNSHTLPPTIEAIVKAGETQWLSPREYVTRAAHEACRLQRGADYRVWGTVLQAYEDEVPLVVPSTEDGE